MGSDLYLDRILAELAWREAMQREGGPREEVRLADGTAFLGA